MEGNEFEIEKDWKRWRGGVKKEGKIMFFSFEFMQKIVLKKLDMNYRSDNNRLDVR